MINTRLKQKRYGFMYLLIGINAWCSLEHAYQTYTKVWNIPRCCIANIKVDLNVVLDR